MSSAVTALAEELPDHQTSRGAEFRDISVEERHALARKLVQARSQANSSRADWDSDEFVRAMCMKKNVYFYIAGELGIDIQEAMAIWWSVVHDSPAPVEKNRHGLI